MEDAQKPEGVRKDFGSHFKSLDLTLRAMKGAPSKSFKQESHLSERLNETFLSLKISGQWEQPLAPDLEPQRLPASREKGAHGSKDLGSWSWWAGEGGPEHPTSVLGRERSCLFKRPARHQIPDQGAQLGGSYV